MRLHSIRSIPFVALALASPSSDVVDGGERSLPNIVLVLADDRAASKSETADHDLAAAQPEVVRALVETLASFFGADGVGRSRPSEPSNAER